MPYLDDNLLVFTDLDGSLLDHHSYDWQPAQAWLDRLGSAKVPVILTTSKTSAEVATVQKQLQLTHYPFIAENGALIKLPADWPGNSDDVSGHIIGNSYSEIRQTLVSLRQRYDFEFRGFGDVSKQQVMDWTGLSLENAALAMQREASEPLIWFGSDFDLAHFEKCLQAENLSLTRGGRFWHVAGREAGKGSAVHWLTGQYRQQRDQPPVTIGLGDGPNDIGMLNATDYAVVILGHHDHAMPLDNGENVYRTRQHGPQGWKEGLDHFITL